MMKRILLAGVAILALPSMAQAQSLNGKRVGIEYYFPTQSSLYDTAGANTVGTDPATRVIGTFDLGFTDTSATASNFSGAGGWTGSAFNGFRLFDIDGTIGDFQVTLGASNMGGLDASRITGDANNVYVNWQGLSFDNNTNVTLDFAAAGAVPEPASWALMMVGFGAVGGAMRTRTRKATLRLA